jgi:hypothetical protein
MGRVMAESRIVPALSSAAFLAEGGALKREPRAAKRQRPQAFYEKFEAYALAYDCFWHADGERILIVGPPPLNLKRNWQAARFLAMPSGTDLKAESFASESVMVTALAGAPADTTAIKLALDGERFELNVQPNLSQALAGSRLLFTMSKDNDLDWIRSWADYHARRHGADAVLFFDNGSTRYGTGDVEETLLSVPGLHHVAVASWPFKYGSPDPAVLNNPFYTLFLQIASMSVALRRYGAKAHAILNCDIDELVHTPQGTTIFDLAAQSPKGLVVMEGRFVEALTAVENPVHADFPMRLKDKKARRSSPRKWALDPNRDWVRELDVHPYMHWIHGRPAFAKTQRPDIFYWHFRGISTNWKDRRTETGHLEEAMLEVDRDWAEAGGRLR